MFQKKILSDQEKEKTMKGIKRIVELSSENFSTNKDIKPYLADFCLSTMRDENPEYSEALLIIGNKIKQERHENKQKKIIEFLKKKKSDHMADPIEICKLGEGYLCIGEVFDKEENKKRVIKYRTISVGYDKVEVITKKREPLLYEYCISNLSTSF